ncbi:MFS general substrate transporter [Apiospora arundinis]
MDASRQASDKSPSQQVDVDAVDGKPAKPCSFYLSVFGLALVALITSWDATSLSIALPVITEQLHGSTLESFWANMIFILGVAVTQPIYVSFSDVLGRKSSLYTSMGLFSIGAIVFALAKNMGTLIAGRLIQGLGAGGLYVLQDIILADITSLKERPRYLGLLALPMALGTILGPIVGALFSEVNWRWIGWINLPIAGVGCIIFVRRLDLVGMAIFALGATAVALPLSWANALYPWSSWKTIVPFVMGLGVLVIFALYEREFPREPLLPFRVIANITATSSLVSGFLHGSILYTILLYIPLYFQSILLEAPLEAAISTLPICCLTVAFSFIAPIIVEITRHYRTLIWIGWVVITLFMGLWCLVGQNTSRAEIYAFQSLLGAGVGTVFTGAQIPMQASVPDADDTGLAVGTLIVVRLFGALIGLSISSTVFSSVFGRSIAALKPLPQAIKVLDDPSQAVNFIPMLRLVDIPEKSRLIEAYQQPFRAIWIVMTCFAGAGFVASLFIKRLSLEREETSRQGFEHSRIQSDR